MTDYILSTAPLMQTQNSRTLSFVSEMKTEMKFRLATLMMTVLQHVQLKAGTLKAPIILTIFGYRTARMTIMLFTTEKMEQPIFMTHRMEQLFMEIMILTSTGILFLMLKSESHKLTGHPLNFHLLS